MTIKENIYYLGKGDAGACYLSTFKAIRNIEQANFGSYFRVAIEYKGIVVSINLGNGEIFSNGQR